MLRCTQNNNVTGRRCSREFRRPFGLKRHINIVHQVQTTTFQSWHPDSAQRYTDYHASPTSSPPPSEVPRAPSTTSFPPPEAQHASPRSSPAPLDLSYAPGSAPVADMGSPSAAPLRSMTAPYAVNRGLNRLTTTSSPSFTSAPYPSPPISGTPCTPTSSASPRLFDSNIPYSPVPSGYETPSNPSDLDELDTPLISRYANPVNLDSPSLRTTSSPAQNAFWSQPKDLEHSLIENESSSSRQKSGVKRKRSVESFDRASFARTAPPMPTYALTMSTRVPQQLKGAEWVTARAKTVFEQEYTRRLAEWGVNSAHKSTCIMIPEEWKGLDPLSLVTIFDVENCPTASSARLRYQYSDHVTSFARALAWFSQWPRGGLQLDNFFGSGPFKPMDASHTCHHHTCIVHVQYEDALTNQDRKDCRDFAIKLRTEKKEVRQHCDKHDPPCLMQVHGLEPVVFPRPRRHRYGSFVVELPTRFEAINPDLTAAAPESSLSTRKEGKPEFICPFCTKIRGYDSLAGYWGHIVYKHDGLDTELRLNEIRRTAPLWAEYWDQHSDGGKRQLASKQRIKQVQEDDFSWDVVLSWSLR